MTCPRCAKQNEDEARFCAKCGLNLMEARALADAQPEEDSQFCYRHPKEATNLSCGRCERPICTKCAVIGPAGPRCPDCAKTKTEFRAGAVGLGAKRAARSLTQRGPWAWYYLVLIGMMLFGAIQTCSHMFNKPDSGQVYIEGEPYEPDR